MAGETVFHRILDGTWASDGVLWRPLTRAAGVSELEYWRMFTRASDLGSPQPTWDSIIGQLRESGLRSLMATLSDLNQLLHNDGVATPELQARFRKDLRPERQVRLATLRNADQRILYFPQQILLLMKLALLHAPNRDDPRSDEVWRDVVVDLLLQVSDLLPSPMASPDDAPSEDDMLRFHIQTFVFNHTEQYRYLIPRAWIMYTELPAEPDLRDDSSFMDVPTIFQRATGLELHEYIAFGFALLAGFVGRSLVRNRYNGQHRAINPQLYFDLPRLGTRGQQMLASLSADHRAMRAAVVARAPDTQRFASDFLSFMATPLYQIQDNLTVPVHLPFLEARFTSGIYWTLVDHLEHRERLRFMRFFGKLFERYVRNLIQRAIPDTHGLTRRVFPEFPYSAPAGEQRTSDVVIVYEHTALFVEVTAGRLRLEDTLLAADLTAFDHDLQRIVLRKARQLNRCIRDFRENRFTFDGQTARDLRHIQPVIVTPESLPEGRIFWNHVRGRLAAEHLLEDPLIDPLQLLDIEELEMLEPVIASGRSFLTILQRRQEQHAGDVSFKNHLLTEYRPNVNAFLSAKNEEILAFARNLIFGTTPPRD